PCSAPRLCLGDIVRALSGRNPLAIGEDDLNRLPWRKDVDIGTPSHAQGRWSEWVGVQAEFLDVITATRFKDDQALRRVGPMRPEFQQCAAPVAPGDAAFDIQLHR